MKGCFGLHLDIIKLTCFARLSLYLKLDGVEDWSETNDSRTCSRLWTTSENELP